MSEKDKGGATRLIEGVASFQQQAFAEKESLFRELSKGQSPSALFITCSDSRINPNLLTQTDPGELFILRNAGNIVPPYGSAPSGSAATVEYALAHLKIRDVIVCGHSYCGAVGGLLSPRALDKLPAMRGWLRHAAGVAQEVEQFGANLSPEERFELAVERNVVKQIENLKTHPAIRDAIAENRVRIHAWVYHFETGLVTAHDPANARFVSLADAPRPKWTPTTEMPAEGLGSVI